jgi:holliday junction DNA helicase RuvB
MKTIEAKENSMPQEQIGLDVNAYRPQVVDHLIGQQKVLERVKVALEAAWVDGIKFPNSVLTGGPGLGKSLIAKTIAAEMGVELKETLAQTLSKPSSLRALLLEANDRDVIFLDECDELKPHIQTQLYRALEDRVLFVNSGSNNKTPKVIPLADFTVLAASNNEFSLVAPLRDRFRLTLRFGYYSLDELTAILGQRTQALRWDVEPGVLSRIALMAKQTPRIALRLLEACRRTSRAKSSPTVTVEDFERTRQLEGLDSLGLDETEQQYLQILGEANGSLALNMIAMHLSLPRRTVTGVIEGYLIRSNLITKENSKRKLTPKGIEHLAGSQQEQ